MKKLLIALCLMIPTVSFASYNVIPIVTSVVMADGTINTISGTITGVPNPPSGDYYVSIKNSASLKGRPFSIMYCTITKKSGEKTDSMQLMTTYAIDGKLYSATGYYTGMKDAVPKNGFRVVIKNRGNALMWNSLSCRVK